MKYKIYIILIVFLTLTSCDQFLEEQPYDFLSEANFPETAEDGRIALNGVYDIFGNNSIRGYAYVLNNCADNDFSSYGAKLTSSYGLYQNFNRTSADGYPKSLWIDLYSAINSCNFVIDVTESKGFTGGDQLIAEAKALRAFFYIELTNTFGDAPLKVHNTTGLNELDKSRTSVDEIRQQCIEDLNYAETTMEKYPSTYAVYSKGGLLTLGAVKMIKAHLYMYMSGWRRSWDGQMIAGDESYWTEVRDLCQEIIDMGVYELEPDYTNIFKDLYLDIYNKESIWEIDFSMPENGSNLPNALTAPKYGAGHAGGFGNLRSTIDFYDSFDTLDVRRNWTVGTGKFTGYVFTEKSQVRRPYVNKFRKVEGNGDHASKTPYNTPIYRFSDVYLMLAEALNEINNGPTQEAYDAINMVRYRARPDDHKADGLVLADLQGLDYDSFKTAIIDERAHELAFEGFRRMDIIRWGIFMDRIKMVNDEFYRMNKESNVREYHMLFPIPLEELNQNPEWDQNNGW
ncbi:RagB/SusD family nutrient uptake outer membrane protein [Maribellus comscasis]|uniref:RagB/SusD family nutrient uptake outer membrane protein n=1 Tax=Maribellus comscasis TaxID=2681766 RepID=A0A6I6KCD5_9BACT|nr:RagB/SusD family nutrient uptake outer membrane protein [Maribellus comscasis]QGY47964.1 RagB/SusD family nutrient uptake outer membrane protein [Maribellus comscasis]